TGGKVGMFIEMLDEDRIAYAHLDGDPLTSGDTITGQQSLVQATIATDPGLTAIGFAYKPVPPSLHKSFTFLTIKAGVGYKSHGTRCTAQITIAGAGPIAYFNYTMQGAVSGPPDDTL